MTKVYCANMHCKYLNDDGFCTKEEIGLTYCSIVTLYDGRQEFLKCTAFIEKDDEYYLRLKAIGEEIAKRVNEQINGE